MFGLKQKSLACSVLILLCPGAFITAVCSANASSSVDQTETTSKVPRTAQDYISRAEAHASYGQYEKQIDDLSMAIKMRPTISAYFEKRAEAYYETFQLQKAIDDGMVAMKLNPTSLKAHRITAAAYDDLGNYDKAIGVRTQLLTLKNASAVDWCNRAKDYELIGNLAFADSDLRKAFSFGSPSEQAFVRLNHPFPSESVKGQLRGSSVVLPFHYDGKGHICIPVQIDGNQRHVILDTGLGWSQLCDHTAPGAEQAKQMHLDKDKSGVDFLFRLPKAQELNAGHLGLPSFPMIICGHSADIAPGGFLGGNLLDKFVVTINYQAKQVILTSPAEYQMPSSRIVVPMLVRDHKPYCNIVLDGKLGCVALIDTGIYSNRSSDALVKSIFSKTLSCTGLVEGRCVMTWCEHIRFKSLEIGSFKYDKPVIEIFPAGGAAHMATHLMIGNAFLSNFKQVTFNYPARQMILEPREADTKSALAVFYEGCFSDAQNNIQVALDAFNQAMLLDPDLSSGCHFSRAHLLLETKQYKQAILDLDSAIKIDPRMMRAYEYRARCFSEVGDYERAISDLSTAIRLQPSNSNAYFQRASVYEKLGNHRLAEQDRKKSFK